MKADASNHAYTMAMVQQLRDIIEDRDPFGCYLLGMVLEHFSGVEVQDIGEGAETRCHDHEALTDDRPNANDVVHHVFTPLAPEHAK